MITTLSRLKARLGIDEFDVSEDTLLTNLILHCGERFEKECNRRFERTVGATYEFDADRLNLIPSRYPIETVTSFELKSSETEGWVAQTGVDYILRSADETKCMVCLSDPLGDGDEVARITYTGGYVMPGGTVSAGQTAFPDSLEQAAHEQITAWRRDKDRLGLANVSGQGGSVGAQAMNVVAPLDLLPHVYNLLKRFERYNP